MTDVIAGTEAPPDGSRRAEVEAALALHRSELTGYCYRMLGSVAEAEDAVQDTLLRAWRASDSFEGRAAVRSWLYRIATNVCLDMLKSRKRRARPVDLGPAATASAAVLTPLPEATWIEPAPDVEVLPATDDPAEETVLRESIRLAFIAALQILPARQRAVLILREVLRWQATEVAALLDTSVQSVNSALQRARATLASQELEIGDMRDEADDEQQSLLARYVDAFERYDLDSLVALLHEDLVMSMPPYDLWLTRSGRAAGRGFLVPATAAGFSTRAGDGQRVTGVRPVPPERTRRAAGAVVDPGAGDPGWTDHVTDELPRQGPLRQVRPARPPGTLTATLVA